MKRDWLQLFTNIAVVIGVIVLIFEIRQTHFLTRVELISERQNLYVGWFGPGIVNTLVKRHNGVGGVYGNEKKILSGVQKGSS